jgi:hypothetical protein
MKMLARALAVAPLFAVLASPLGAQGVGGRWIAELDRMVRNENGNVSTGEKAKVRLVLEQRGDSITGTLAPVDAPAGGPPARLLRGTVSGNKVSLSSEAEVRRNMNGEESVVRVTMVYDLTLNGDTLEGTMVARMPDRDMPGRPFSARREKL